MYFLKLLYFKFFCKKIIKYHIDYPRDTCDDRNILESVIFPNILAEYNPQTILDIGREDYQSFYNEFFVKRELWTMDMDPVRVEYGDPDRHITDNVVNLKTHFKDNYFDFVLMNGVFGWGLDDETDVQKSFNAIYDILKPGGIFILGYNEQKVAMDKIEGLNKLEKIKLRALGVHEYLCSNGNHTYNFYLKK